MWQVLVDLGHVLLVRFRFQILVFEILVFEIAGESLVWCQVIAHEGTVADHYWSGLPNWELLIG